MRGLIFLALIPGLIADHVLCPNGKTTCPEELYCCKIDGQPTCCDGVPPDPKIRIYPGIDTTEVRPATLVFPNESISEDIVSDDMPLQLRYGTACNSMSCIGPCCTATNCCPHKFGSCCAANICCGDHSPCCKTGDGSTGCCNARSTCCGSHCCAEGTKCCSTASSKWCCEKKYNCGKQAFSCTSTGVTVTAEIATVLVLTLGFLMSRYL